MQIKKDVVVTMHYHLKNREGETIDSSEGKVPLLYLHGANNIVPGLEEQLEGKQVGDAIQAEIAPEKGYGMPIDALIQTVPMEVFGEDIKDIQVGMRFQAETEQGSVPVVVTSIEDGQVTVDGNHPLAGQHLFFDVRVEDVREATAEEIEHGHVHGEGGVAH